VAGYSYQALREANEAKVRRHGIADIDPH